jgi:hypothetical protein
VLPFVADPVQDLIPASQDMAGLVADIDEPVSDLGRAEIAVTIADALSGQPGYDRAGIDVTAAGLAREFLAAHAREQTPAAALEKITGTDRFTLARHFRRAFGTNPDGTGPSTAWTWPGRRSKAESRSHKPPLTRDSPTRAT